MLSNTLASVAVPVSAIFLPDWRALIVMATCPIPLVIFANFFGYVPESLSWLICEGKIDLARSAVEKVARINGKSLEVSVPSIHGNLTF